MFFVVVLIAFFLLLLLLLLLLCCCSPQTRQFGQVQALGPFKKIQDERCSFSRAVINGSLIESTSYVRNRQRNNFTVRTSSGFALVEEFFGDQATSQVQSRVRVLVPHHNPSFEKAPLISGFLCSDHHQTIDAREISEGPLICVSKTGVFHIIALPFSPETR